MQDEFKREQLIKEKSELDKEIELVRNIIKTREELKNDNRNFEFAEMELVDYYIYQIKANQAKLDYLLKANDNVIWIFVHLFSYKCINKIRRGMSMETNIITYLACICFLFIFGRVFIVPIKKVLKLVINSILGGVAIFFINLIGGIWEFHIGLNIFTSILVGLLGLPGAVCLVILKLLI